MCKPGLCVRGRILLTGALAVAVSAAFAGCGEDTAKKGELLKPDENIAKQTQVMGDFYKTSPPNQKLKKK